MSAGGNLVVQIGKIKILLVTSEEWTVEDMLLVQLNLFEQFAATLFSPSRVPRNQNESRGNNVPSKADEEPKRFETPFQ